MAAFHPPLPFGTAACRRLRRRRRHDHAQLRPAPEGIPFGGGASQNGHTGDVRRLRRHAFGSVMNGFAALPAPVTQDALRPKQRHRATEGRYANGVECACRPQCEMNPLILDPAGTRVHALISSSQVDGGNDRPASNGSSLANYSVLSIRACGSSSGPFQGEPLWCVASTRIKLSRDGAKLGGRSVGENRRLA